MLREAADRTLPTQLLQEESFFLQRQQPFTHALHAALCRTGPLTAESGDYLEGLSYQLLDYGPSSLSATEKSAAHRDTVLRTACVALERL
ncbi:MAG: hypothetical protein R3F37_16915 [Candidatus Competibacteraceae bacterium]